ncbi:MAG: hypothetical protein HY016_13295 [Nitrosomonadales bacterium]|nr:hypothetical protein [Nitrosomonadales bacterium]
MIRSAERYELSKLAEIYSALWHLAFSKHFPPENLARVAICDFEERWRGYFAGDAVSSFVYEQDSVQLGFAFFGEQRLIQRYGIELCQLRYERQLPRE